MIFLINILIELLHIDADSCYVSFSSDKFEDLIIQNLENNINEIYKYSFMPRTSQHIRPDYTIDRQK